LSEKSNVFPISERFSCMLSTLFLSLINRQCYPTVSFNK
jgi:hypothetical protein